MLNVLGARHFYVQGTTRTPHGPAPPSWPGANRAGQLPRTHPSTAQRQTGRALPPNAKRVGRWRREMSPTDRRLFQRIGGDLLAELGYEVPDLGPMPARERLRYAALGSKYAMLQAGRRVLQALGLMPPI